MTAPPFDNYVLQMYWRTRGLMAGTERRQVREEIREVLISLLEIRSELEVKLTPITDVQARERLSAAINDKRHLYLAAAESRLPRAYKDLTRHDFFTLGSECQMNSDFKSAEKYFSEALKRADRSMFSTEFSLFVVLGTTTLRPALVKTLSSERALERAVD